MFQKITLLLGVFFILISCGSMDKVPTSVVLDQNGYHINGAPVTHEELENILTEIGEKNDSINVQLIYGYSQDQMFELKRLLNEANVKNIREIK